MNKIFRKISVIVLSVVFITNATLSYVSAAPAPLNFTTPGVHSFTVTQDGTYRVDLYGARGEDATEGNRAMMTGKDGRHIRFEVDMYAGETYYVGVATLGKSISSLKFRGGNKLRSYVRDDDSYLYAQSGRGGGATYLYKDNRIVGIAAGGAGGGAVAGKVGNSRNWDIGESGRADESGQDATITITSGDIYDESSHTQYIGTHTRTGPAGSLDGSNLNGQDSKYVSGSDSSQYYKPLVISGGGGGGYMSGNAGDVWSASLKRSYSYSSPWALIAGSGGGHSAFSEKIRLPQYIGYHNSSTGKATVTWVSAPGSGGSGSLVLDTAEAAMAPNIEHLVGEMEILQTKLTQIDTTVSGVNSTVTSSANTSNAKIDSLGTAVSDIENQLTQLQTNINTVNTTIANDTTSTESKISDLVLQQAYIVKENPQQNAVSGNYLSIKIKVGDSASSPMMRYPGISWTPADGSWFNFPIGETAGLKKVEIELKDSYGNYTLLETYIWKI